MYSTRKVAGLELTHEAPVEAQVHDRRTTIAR